MAAKRKAESHVAVVASSKKPRFDEWLSDSDQDSDTSEPEENLNDGTSGREGSSEEEDMITDHKEASSISNSIQISAAEKSQKTRFSSSRLLLKDLPPTPNIPKGVDVDSSSFAELGVVASLVASLSAMSIRKPTPVQAACIPPLLEGN
jgi:ATP-dependent RNA helicase DDX49/DBP8